jgi:hypothetical protein
LLLQLAHFDKYEDPLVLSISKFSPKEVHDVPVFKLCACFIAYFSCLFLTKAWIFCFVALGYLCILLYPCLKGQTCLLPSSLSNQNICLPKLFFYIANLILFCKETSRQLLCHFHFTLSLVLTSCL